MSKPKHYRKKPVVIEAMQWRGGPSEASEVIDWMLATGETGVRWHEKQPEPIGPDGMPLPTLPQHIAIDTLEGTMRADVGDYVIRGVQGEFYPCKPDIFAKTYEVVTPHQAQPVIHDVDWALAVLQKCGIETADQFDALVTLQKLTP
ncbi:hypothetical protein [Arthrobacter sp. ok362]|uniref:hypothetical protein n=1 Tax=Arthrobacter sp. ok362 TaxID=1761745 RepID=UPI000881FC02|nr:hypothetical protein [Arthrobacter sp. ok362]SDK79993.1 hypothetical protein SAMN04487913_103221 [Arthrobacter sp. ok362]